MIITGCRPSLGPDFTFRELCEASQVCVLKDFVTLGSRDPQGGRSGHQPLGPPQCQGRGLCPPQGQQHGRCSPLQKG